MGKTQRGTDLGPPSRGSHLRCPPAVSKARRVRQAIVSGMAILLCGNGGTAPAAGQDFSLDRRFDQYTYLASHNAFANDKEDYLSFVANQSNSIIEQLNDGVRCLMFDTHLARQRAAAGTRFAELYAQNQPPSPDFVGQGIEVVLAHNPADSLYTLLDGYPVPFAYPAFRKLRQDLAKTKLWMDAHPREIVAIVLESYFVDPPLMLAEFAAAGLAEMIFWADRPNPEMYAPDGTLWEVAQHGWPRVGLMADVNRRLVVFSNQGEEQDGLPHQWDYMSENVYGDDSLEPATCAGVRAESAGLAHKSYSLLFVNYFPSFNAFGADPFDDVNDATRITSCLAAIRDVTSRPPSFLAVDHYHKGNLVPVPPFAISGPAQVVASLNALVWPSVPTIEGAHAISPPANAAGWHRSAATASLDGLTAAGTITWVEYDIRGALTESSHDNGPLEIELTGDGDYLVNYQVVASLENRSDARHFRVRIDLQPPVSEIGLLPPEAVDEWAGEPILVEIASSDLRSGVDSTWFRIDGGAATQYSGSFELASDTFARLDYWSVDVAGNAEAVRSVTIPSCPLDLDKNDSLQASTDGVYGFRALLGLQTIVPSLFRTLDPSIPSDQALAEAMLFLGDALDVDGDGKMQAATDGVYIFRRLLGLKSIVPTVFRQLSPGIPSDEVIAANIDALCSAP